MHRKRAPCVAGGGTEHKNRMVVVVNPWNVVNGGLVGVRRSAGAVPGGAVVAGGRR